MVEAGATGICRPDGDNTTQWNVGGAASHYDALDDDYLQPEAPPTSDYIYAIDGDENAVDQLTMTTIDDVKEINKIVVWCYGKNAVDAGVDPKVNIYCNGWLGQQTLNLTLTDSWQSLTWASLSKTKADLDGMEIQFTANSNYGTLDGTYIQAAYVEVYYDRPIPIGVSGASIKFLYVSGASKQILTTDTIET